METLRRVRFVWALACLLAAGLCAVVGIMGNPVIPAAWPWCFAALCGMFAFYQGTPFRMFSMLWSGCAALYYGAMVAYKPLNDLLLIMLVVFGGGWVLAATLAWVLKPLLQRKNSR